MEFVLLLALIGVIIYGLSCALGGLIGPLGDMMAWMAAHGPWPASLAPLGAVMACFAVLRLLGAALHIKMQREAGEERSVVFGLLLAVLDGVFLFIVARTAEAAGPALLAGEPWLMGTEWAPAGKGFVAALFLAGAVLLSAGAVYGLTLLYDEFTATLYDFDPEKAFNCILIPDVLIILPAIVGIAVAYEKNPFILIVALGYCLVRLLSAAAFSTVALTAEWIEDR